MVLSYLCFIIIGLKHIENQITPIKFETVNGKKTGKSFSFKADSKKLVVFKTEATLMGVLKLRSCMLLFVSVSDETVFKKVINKYHW